MLRRKCEPAEGIFVVEGKLALQAVLASPYPVASVLVLRRRLGVLDDVRLPAGVPVYVADADVMSQVAGFDVHRGLLAVARRLAGVPVAELLARTSGSRLLVVAEGISDQENLGALFRNAVAFGAGAILLDPTCADPLYRRSVRVSLGLVLRVPFARLEPWPAGLGLVSASGFTPVALTPSPGAETVGKVAQELRGQKVALIVGAEGPGLSRAVLGMCRRARVPMVAGVDSLNVAAATAVALYCFAGLA